MQAIAMLPVCGVILLLKGKWFPQLHSRGVLCLARIISRGLLGANYIVGRKVYHTHS